MEGRNVSEYYCEVKCLSSTGGANKGPICNNKNRGKEKELKLIIIKGKGGKGRNKSKVAIEGKWGKGEERSRHKETGEESCPKLGGKNMPQGVLPENGDGGGYGRNRHNFGQNRDLGT
jgi:hypothetical protein